MIGRKQGILGKNWAFWVVMHCEMFLIVFDDVDDLQRRLQGSSDGVLLRWFVCG